MRKHSKLLWLIGNKNFNNNGFYMFNYGRFQGKFETKSGLAAILNEIENKYFSGANFYEQPAYESTQSHGLRCFSLSLLSSLPQPAFLFSNR